MDTPKIAFIINPGSGNIFKKSAKARLTEYLKENTDYPVYLTRSAEDSTNTVKRLVQEGYAAIFACGGDGTLNSVSKELLYTSTALGVIPMGSGNGFARNFGIPLKWTQAVWVAKNPKEITIDTGSISGRHFINVAGLGYSAHVTKAFKRAHGRGISGYVKVIMKNLFIDSRKIHFKSENAEHRFEAWTVEFFNGTQWGANTKVAAKAKADDGKLDLVAFKKIPFALLPYVAFRTVINWNSSLKQIQRARFENAHVNFEGIWGLHTDGDYTGKIKGKVDVEIRPLALKVWVPNK